MGRAKLLIVVSLVVASAGCAGIFGTDSASEPTLEEPTPESAETQTATSDEGEPSATYEPTLPTGDLLLSLREVPSPLNKSGERLHLREDLSEEELATYRERGIERFHERTFSHSDAEDETPSIVVSTAIVYESSSDADRQLDTTLSNLSTNGATVSQTEVAGDITVRTAQFENDVGLHTVGYYYQSENLVFYVLAADEDEDRTEFTQERFLDMYAAYRSLR
jgi:hypothetical protein